MIATFISGISLATFGACAYFFYRFWKGSKDSFFLHFCIACGLLAVERLALVMVGETTRTVTSELTEASFLVYLFRLAAFIFILIAVVQRNRQGMKNRQD